MDFTDKTDKPKVEGSIFRLSLRGSGEKKMTRGMVRQRMLQNKGPRIVILSVALIILTVVLGGVFMFRNELKSLNSLKKIDDNVLYTMTYEGDYGFDEFLEKGAKSDEELVQFVTEQLLKGLPMEFSIPDLGCSSFNAQTEEGEWIFGRNFDLTFSPALIVETSPANGYRSLSTVNLSFLGYGEDKLPDTWKQKLITLAAPYAPLDGINEKGLTVAVLKIADDPTNQNTGKTDITTTTAIRLMLDKAATVDEAVELLKRYDMHSSAGSCYHFQIADAQGSSAVVEYVDNEFEVIRADKSYQMVTNFIFSDKKYNFGNGQDRYEILKTALDKREGVIKDEKEAMDLLQAASKDWHVSEASGRLSATQWSIVFNNSRLTAKIITGRQYDKPAHEFSLE